MRLSTQQEQQREYLSGQTRAHAHHWPDGGQFCSGRCSCIGNIYICVCVFSSFALIFEHMCSNGKIIQFSSMVVPVPSFAEWCARDEI